MKQSRTASRPNTLLHAVKNALRLQKKSSALEAVLGSRLQHTMLHEIGKPVWTPRAYDQFANEAYGKNVVAYRCITMIAKSAAGVPWKLMERMEDGSVVQHNNHAVLTLLQDPNPSMSGKELLEALFSFYLISGNAYVMVIHPTESLPKELHILRPDRVKVIAGKSCIPEGYLYQVDGRELRFPVHPITGFSDIMHLKHFHPLNDWYGLSPVEAAAYSIDQHNQASEWNQALLQNGAKPSGAIIVKSGQDGTSHLTDEQFERIRGQIQEEFTGSRNAGRPLLLEGGLEWKEMSLSPKDMDFIDSKHSTARDIANAFGVPPQLLGIPGDNTYSNLAEARLALWEQTIMPLLENVTNAINTWLTPRFGKQFQLQADTDQISALQPRRELVWSRIQNADFMTVNEKRHAVGLPPIVHGDRLVDGV